MGCGLAQPWAGYSTHSFSSVPTATELPGEDRAYGGLRGAPGLKVQAGTAGQTESIPTPSSGPATSQGSVNIRRRTLTLPPGLG